MRSRQTIVGVSILGLALLGSFFFITSITKKEFSVVSPRYQLAAADFADASLLSSSSTPERYDARAFAQEIAASIIERNPNGPDLTTGTILASQPEDLVDTLLVDGIEKITLDILDPKLDEARITRGSDDSRAARETYLRERVDAIARSPISLNNADITSFSASDFAAVAATLERVLTDIYSLSVPPSLLDIHHEQLRLLSIEHAIFENLAFYQQDSLRAWLSVPIFEKISGEFVVLKESIADFILTNDLRV